MLVGVFLVHYGRVAAFLVGLCFSLVNENIDEPVEMVIFPWVNVFSINTEFSIGKIFPNALE